MSVRAIDPEALRRVLGLDEEPTLIWSDDGYVLHIILNNPGIDRCESCQQERPLWRIVFNICPDCAPSDLVSTL